MWEVIKITTSVSFQYSNKYFPAFLREILLFACLPSIWTKIPEQFWKIHVMMLPFGQHINFTLFSSCEIHKMCVRDPSNLLWNRHKIKGFPLLWLVGQVQRRLFQSNFLDPLRSSGITSLKSWLLHVLCLCALDHRSVFIFLILPMMIYWSLPSCGHRQILSCEWL